MTITRRKLLEVLGASASTLPLSLKSSAGSLSLGGIVTELLEGSAKTVSAVSSQFPDLDFTLNATPAWQLDLSGTWRVAKDPDNRGKQEAWYRRMHTVSGIDQVLPNPLQRVFPRYNGVAWYWRTFAVANPGQYDDLRIYFEGADYFVEAWLNSEYVGGNESALLPFAFDAKHSIKPGANELVVRVIDACYAKEIDGFQLGKVPGGRQHDNPWEPGFRHFNYGGLLLPVRVQAFRRPWIADAFIRPNISSPRIDVDLSVVGEHDGEWVATVRAKGSTETNSRTRLSLQTDKSGYGQFSVHLNDPHLWDVWDGFLYELEIAPAGGGTSWRGTFGMREVSILGGRIAVNQRPILQRSFLYNQIWPVTLGAPYQDLAHRDVELARKTNANMLRCFSKTPLLATVQAADQLGMLLQHESLGSWYLKNGSLEEERLANITLRAVLAYRNHPSLLWWNVLNENAPKFDPKRPYPTDEFTLGPYVLQSVFSRIHALDSTRPVLANDPVWHDVNNIWEPGKSAPTLPFVQDHYYQFTALENNEESWETIRQRKWGEAENPSAAFKAVTEWGVNSSPVWDTLLKSYKDSGLAEDAEDYSLYRKLHDINLQHYEESGVQRQGFPTFESVVKANHEYVAWRYHEQIALYWGNLHSVGHGLTSLEDSSYELSGVVDNWRNPKPGIFETITKLNEPLQINLWVRPSCIYSGDSIGLDATLVNERQRLACGKYALRLSVLNEQGHAVYQKNYSHKTTTDPIELLVTDSIALNVPAGRYRLALDLEGTERALHAERPVVVFERRPRSLPSRRAIVVTEEGAPLFTWLSKRSVYARHFEAGKVQSGDLILSVQPNPRHQSAVLEAVRAGAVALVLQPAAAFHDSQSPIATQDLSAPISFSELLEPLEGGWKPELRRIDWWGAPSAWGYTRTALALQHKYLEGLPQAVALEAQPEYQKVAPMFTWVMNNPPKAVDFSHAVRESSVAVDMPYCSDLFAINVGHGQLVLTSLHIVQNLDTDPAADIILENIILAHLKQETSNVE